MSKSLIYLGMFVGSTIGTYTPMIFGIDPFSVTSLITGAIGGIIGIFLMVKIVNY